MTTQTQDAPRGVDPWAIPRNVCNTPISFFPTRFTVEPTQEITLAQWVACIEGGDQKDRVARIRDARGTPAYDEIKKQLGCVSYGGTFPEGRKGRNPENPSGLVFLEVDFHDGAPPEGWLTIEKCRLFTFPSVVAVYVSAGGQGLHVVASVDPIPTTRQEYKMAWAWATRDLGLQESGDIRVKDSTRVAAISHDRLIFHRATTLPLHWEPNTLDEDGKGGKARKRPEDMAGAFRLVAAHFGIEWAGSDDEACKTGMRMPCHYHGGDAPDALHVWLGERTTRNDKGEPEATPTLFAKCFTQDCDSRALLRWLAVESGIIWPAPGPGSETVAEEFLSTYPHRLAVVDRSRLFMRRENGLWVDATRSGPVASAALQSMLKDMFGDGAWSQRQTDDVRTALFHVMERPATYGVQSVRSDDFDRTPLFPLRKGGAIDARTLKILDNDGTAGAYMMDQESPGVDYRPELLDAGPEHPGMRLALHFEKDADKANPKFQILRRLAYLLLGPVKAVDTIVIPLSDAGKSTLARWLYFSLPGYVSLLDAVVALSTQGTRFTAVQHRLSMYKLVILDESDKIDKPPSPGAFNSLTADVLTVELKGKDSYESPRRGNAVMIGAAPPHLELGQGGRERLGWAFDGANVPVMPPEVRALIDDPEAQAWLATKLLTLAKECYDTGSQAIDGDSRKAAATVHQATANPLQSALADCLVQDDTSIAWSDDIKECLKKYLEVPQPIQNRAFGAAIQLVFGHDMKALSTTKDGKSARYYAGVRLTDAPDLLMSLI